MVGANRLYITAKLNGNPEKKKESFLLRFSKIEVARFELPAEP